MLYSAYTAVGTAALTVNSGAADQKSPVTTGNNNTWNKDDEIILSDNIMSFFERTYDTLYEYVNSNDDTISDDIAQECIQQLIDNELKDNPIKMTESFINEEKVGIWKKIKIKLKENFYLYDKLSKDIDVLWRQWSRYLFEKESREAEKDHLFSAPLTSPSTSRTQFFSPGYTPSNPSPSPLSAHSSSPLTSSLPSPAPSNTSSSTYFSSPSPATSYISDDIIERCIIQVTTEDGKLCGHFKYAKKQNDKVKIWIEM